MRKLTPKNKRESSFTLILSPPPHFIPRVGSVFTTSLQHKSLVKNAGTGKHYDRDGLFLRVSNGGSKHWLQRLATHGRTREMGMGSYPLVSLRRSKTDQAGECATLYLTQKAAGLTPHGIAKILRGRFAAAGIENIWTHGLRRGSVEALVRKGVELPAVMATGRWKGPGMVARHTKDIQAQQGAVAELFEGGGAA